MTIISPIQHPDFEAWFIQEYPRLFEVWESDYSDMLDLDEWVEREYWKIIDKWQAYRQTSKRVSLDN